MHSLAAWSHSHGRGFRMKGFYLNATIGKVQKGEVRWTYGQSDFWSLPSVGKRKQQLKAYTAL